MTHAFRVQRLLLAAAVVAVLAWGPNTSVWALRHAPARAMDDGRDFNDSHFHLTNYIQQGIDVRDFLRIMGTRVHRSALFGIPLQQQWSYMNSADFAPV